MSRLNFRKPQPIRLVIADPYAELRTIFRCRLKAETDLKVIGEASDGAEALKLVRELKPDILLLYPRLPDQSGFDVVKELNTPANATPVRVIWFEVFISKVDLVIAFKLGARGFVLKQDGIQVLSRAIQTVMAREYWVHRQPVSSLEQYLHEERQKKFSLTPRDLEIVSAVGAGYSNKEIAEYFKIGVDTVKDHFSNIYDKLGVSTRLGLALFAVNQQLSLKSIEPPPGHSPHKPTAQ